MKYSVLSALLSTVSADASWNYDLHGADWGEGCIGVTNQSPINVSSEGSSDFNYEIIRDEDLELYSYYNQRDRTVTWNGHTSQIDLEMAPGQELGFTSDIPKFYGAQDELNFDAKQFHFHSPSEHTIDGEYYDLEMHTVHFTEEMDTANADGFIAAAVGIMFSVERYTADLTDAERMIVDDFFENLDWDDNLADPIADVVSYGSLMNTVNFHKRWVYSGSVTTPPCATKVFWNLMSTVYPISQRHVDQFKAQLDRATGLAKVGNYRAIQQIDNQDVRFVDDMDQYEGMSRGRDSGDNWDQEGPSDMVEMSIGGTEIRIRMAASKVVASLAVIASGAMTFF